MDDRTIIDKSYHRIFTIMKFIGIYPSNKPSTFRKVICLIVYLILQVLVVTLALVQLMLQDDLNIVNSFYMIVFVEGTGITALRIIPFLINGERLKRCVNYFGDPRFRPQDEYEKNLIDNSVAICNKTSSLIINMLVSALIFWFIPVFLSFGSKLPVDAWLPYDPFSNKLYFYATLIFLIIANIYSITVSTIPDPLVGTLSFHATTQMKILKYNLRNFHKFVEEATEDETEVVTFEKAYKILVRCVKLHNDILYFVTEYEACFSWVFLCQITVCTLILCTCATGLSFSPFLSLDFFKCLNYYCFNGFQTLFYCLFGALLTAENDGFMDAICDGPWHRYDCRVRKILFIMMERSKKPLVVTAGKVVPLGFQLYISIMRTSYSLIALLKNV